MPRFETLAEREARLKREREIAEFGEVDVAFSLSTPNPNCTYYTELPADECRDAKDEGAASETVLVSNKEQPGGNEARRTRSRRQKTAAKGTDRDAQRQCWGEPASDRLKGGEARERSKSRRGNMSVSPEEASAQYHQATNSDPRRRFSSSFRNQRAARNSERVTERGNAASCPGERSVMDTGERPTRLRKRTTSPAKDQRPVLHNKFSPRDSISARYSGLQGSQSFPYSAGLPRGAATKLTIAATS